MIATMTAPPPDIFQRLGALAEVFPGLGASREEAAGQEGDRMPVIGVRDLQDGGVAPREMLDTISVSSRSRAEPYVVRPDDVLVTGRGTILKFGLVGDATAGAVASANIIVVRPGPKAIGPALFASLSSDVFRPRIELLRRGSTTLLSLSAKDLANIEVRMPSLDEQRRIASLVLEAHAAYRAAIEAAEIRRELARRVVDARLFGTLPAGDTDA